MESELADLHLEGGITSIAGFMCLESLKNCQPSHSSDPARSYTKKGENANGIIEMTWPLSRENRWSVHKTGCLTYGEVIADLHGRRVKGQSHQTVISTTGLHGLQDKVVLIFLVDFRGVLT